MAAATPCDRPVRVAFDTPPGPGRSPPPATGSRHPPAPRRPCRPAPGQPTGAPPPGISRKKARPAPPGPARPAPPHVRCRPLTRNAAGPLRHFPAPGRKDQFSHSPAAPLHPRSDPRHRRWSWRGDFARVTISAAPPCPKTFTGRGVEHRNHWFVPVGPRPCRVRHRFPLVSHVPSAPGAPGAAAACAHGPRNAAAGRRPPPGGAGAGVSRQVPAQRTERGPWGARPPVSAAPAAGAPESGAGRPTRRSNRPRFPRGGGELMRTAPEAGRRSFTYRRQTPRKGPQICQGCASLR